MCSYRIVAVDLTDGRGGTDARDWDAFCLPCLNVDFNENTVIYVLICFVAETNK